MYKIVIFEKNNFIQETIKHLHANNLKFEILLVNTKERALELINDGGVNLILLDGEAIDDMHSDKAEIQILNQLKVKVPPVILFFQTKEKSIQSFRFCNMKKTFTHPINYEDLFETIEMILTSDVFINSLVEYNECEDIALKMASVTRTIAAQLELDDSKYALTVYALMILSTVAKSESLQKTLKFCLDMGVHQKILQLIKNINHPKTAEEQFIYIMYKIAKAFAGNKNLDEIEFHHTVDTYLVGYIKNVITEHFVLVNCIADFEIAWEMFLDLVFSENSIALDRANEYFGFIREQMTQFIKCGLIDNRNMAIKMLNRDGYISFVAFLNCNDKISAEQNIIPAPNKSIEASIWQMDEKYALVIAIKINFATGDTEISTLIDEFSDYKIISSKEYIHSLSNIDISDELQEMQEIEKAWEREVLFCSLPSIGAVQEVGRGIVKYGQIIDNLFYEFKGISYALINLGSMILELDTNIVLSHEELQKVMYMLGLLKEELFNWREKVFIEQSVENIHYLDTSMLVSCALIEESLGSKNLVDSSGELIFF